MKKIVLLVFVLIISSLMVYSHGEEDFAEAERIIDEKIQCEQLTNEQLERIGDYYMEQMHPGEAHQTMDEMMGGEGSESLKQAHINIAYSSYCSKTGAKNLFNMHYNPFWVLYVLGFLAVIILIYYLMNKGK